MRTWTSAGLALLALVTCVGCYTFVPVQDTPTPGETVRANLSGPGALRLSELTGEPNRFVIGEVSAITGREVDLVVLMGRSHNYHQAGFEIRDTLRIPRDDILSFEERRLSTWRTTLALASGGGVLAYLLERALSGRGRSTGDEMPDPNGPTTFKIPIFTVPAPF